MSPADRSKLTPLELADRNAAPPIRGADDGRVHQVEHGPFTKGVRDPWVPPAEDSNRTCVRR